MRFWKLLEWLPLPGRIEDNSIITHPANAFSTSPLTLTNVLTNESAFTLQTETQHYAPLSLNSNPIWTYNYPPQHSTAHHLIRNQFDPQLFALAPRLVPDITDKQTVLNLAKIAANAYVPTPHEGDWSDTEWNHSGFGWNDDRVRGYVFTTEDKDTLVISMKGTSIGVLDDGGPTGANDKINDNLLFSCCCARVSVMWSTVCDCFLGDQTCDISCLERSLYKEDRYYMQALNIYDQARQLYPHASNIIFVGHSLGGALASLMGRTFGYPAITFQAPGERLAVQRLHLPRPPGIPLFDDHIYHFGHNADPIYMGTCKGSGSTCWLKGFAMETKCHSGKTCMFDVKEDLGWHESIVNHRIHVVIDDVIEKYDEMPTCIEAPGCTDCEDWQFIDPGLPEESSPPTSSLTTVPIEPTKYKSHLHSASHSTPCTVSHGEPTTITSCVKHNWHWGCDQYTTYTTYTE